MLAWQSLVPFVCTKKEPTPSQVNSFGLCCQILLVSKCQTVKGGILVYPNEEITEHSYKDMQCGEGTFALSQDLQCQSQCSPGSTPPRQTSAPESIWNQFSNENLGQKWGRAPPGQNMFVSKCVRGHRQTEHTSFYRAILLCALACNYFYIWMMSLCVDDTESSTSQLRFLELPKALTMYSCHRQINTQPNRLINILVSIDKKITYFCFSWPNCLSLPMVKDLLLL